MTIVTSAAALVGDRQAVGAAPRPLDPPGRVLTARHLEHARLGVQPHDVRRRHRRQRQRQSPGATSHFDHQVARLQPGLTQHVLEPFAITG